MAMAQAEANVRRLIGSPARERAIAYSAGRHAAENHEGVNACPYEDATRRRVWLLGWHSGVDTKDRRSSP